MEPRFDNTGDTEEIRKEMVQKQEQSRREHAAKMDELLSNVSKNMDNEEEDIRDDGRRHVDMKKTLTSLQSQLAELLRGNGL